MYKKKRKDRLFFSYSVNIFFERETRLELATSCLEGKNSTTELLPLICGGQRRIRTSVRHGLTDLQSVPFNHFGICPFIYREYKNNTFFLYMQIFFHKIIIFKFFSYFFITILLNKCYVFSLKKFCTVYTQKPEVIKQYRDKKDRVFHFFSMKSKKTVVFFR